MKKTWPVGVIAVERTRLVEEHEYGWYWCYAQEEETHQLVKKDEHDSFCYKYIYVWEPNMPSPPGKPKQTLELEPGLYYVQHRGSGHWVYREKRSDGNTYDLSGDQVANKFDTQYKAYRKVTIGDTIEMP